jgi:LPS export ABC transporter protein LptC
MAPLRLRGVALEGWSGGVRDLSVEAREAVVDLELRVAQLEQVRIGVSGTNGGALEVEAPTGEFDLTRDALALRGGVEGRTEPGERFTTEEVHFDQELGRLRSDDPVRLQRPGLDLRASSMDLDLRARRLKLKGAVSAALQPR